MAVYTFEMAGAHDGTKSITSSDPRVVRFITAGYVINTGEEIGVDINRATVDGVAIETFGHFTEFLTGEVGEQFTAEAQVFVYLTPLHPDEIRIWDADFWADSPHLN